MQTDTNTTQKPSAKTFREPLIKVLGSLTQHVAYTPIPHREVYGPVLALLGMGEDDYGVATGTKNLQTHRWIQFAFMAIKEDGLGVAPKKGQWGLTDDGVQEARKLSGLSPDASGAPETNTAPPPVVPLPIASAYDRDPYLRSLAVAASNCIGFFSTKSQTCMSCPLTGQCRNKQFADMSALAAELGKKDIDFEKLSASKKDAPPAGVKKQGTKPSTKPKKKWSNKNIEKIINHTETVCCRCGEPIPMKAQCYWQQEDGGESGLFHLECE